MKQKEKLNAIKSAHPIEWRLLRNRTFDELSSTQELFCCCGRLATGLHESRCSKFNAKVDKEALKRWEDVHGKIEESNL